MNANPTLARRKRITSIKRARRRNKLNLLFIDKLTMEAFGLVAACRYRLAKIERQVEEDREKEESAKKVLQEKRASAKELLQRYADYWLGKYCRPVGHHLPYRLVEKIGVIMNNQVHVHYADGASHRVNEPGGGSQLPSKHAMEIRGEET